MLHVHVYLRRWLCYYFLHYRLELRKNMEITYKRLRVRERIQPVVSRRKSK